MRGNLGLGLKGHLGLVAFARVQRHRTNTVFPPPTKLVAVIVPDLVRHNEHWILGNAFHLGENLGLLAIIFDTTNQQQDPKLSRSNVNKESNKVLHT